jgi:hypothetical protein
MSYTTVNQLTTADPASGEIKNGNGYFIPTHSFFYAADIEKVLKQSTVAPLSNLQLVNVKFDRAEGGLPPKPNHERNEITVLALRKTDDEIAATVPGGDFDNRVSDKSKWHNAVAIAWPPYYRKDSTTSLVDAGNPIAGYNGKQFEGSDDYLPGQVLLKS